jgi:hypothetical protein
MACGMSAVWRPIDQHRMRGAGGAGGLVLLVVVVVVALRW